MLDDAHSDVVALSTLLNRLPIHAPDVRGASFRNPNGVAMKLANFRSLDPTSAGAGFTRGNRLERAVWEQFAEEPRALAAAAQAVGVLAGSEAAAAPVNRWWLSDPRQRYWMEVTARPDIGTDLRAPQADESGRWYWGYGLINEVRPGDVVLHYDQNAEAVVGCSRAVGTVWAADIRWAARGTYARAKGIAPHTRPGWYLGLEAFTTLARPATRAALESRRGELAALKDALEAVHGAPVYFPFMLYKGGRPLSPQQAYLTKCPVELLQLVPELTRALALSVPAESSAPVDPGMTNRRRADDGSAVPRVVLRESGAPLGRDYREADEQAAVSCRDPFAVDPAHVERSLRGHAATQNSLAAWVRGQGLVPRSPSPADPPFDLAWERDGVLWVAEVKSVVPENEEKQLRLGLGQVLRYRHLLSDYYRVVRPVLCVERAPTDPTWTTLCDSLRVALTWPGCFDLSLPLA